MRVLLAGATGAIGLPLTRRLIARGHTVLGLARSPAAAAALVDIGATPILADALDRDGLLRALAGHSADAVINELTALKKPPTHHAGMTATNRLRMEGSANLRVAAERLGARRFVTQSIVLGYGFRDHGATPLAEDAPFGHPEGGSADPHLAAMRSAEGQAFDAPEGVALRYGLFYGGDAAHICPLLARRKVPVVAGGTLAWIHHEDAAAATVAALERARPGHAYNIVDDRPATWREVVTAMADACGAPTPLTVPRWLIRVTAPYAARLLLDTAMRVSNDKARADLGWEPSFPTFVEGVATMRRAPPSQRG